MDDGWREMLAALFCQFQMCLPTASATTAVLTMLNVVDRMEERNVHLKSVDSTHPTVF